jgi:hypothetical protein
MIHGTDDKVGGVTKAGESVLNVLQVCSHKASQVFHDKIGAEDKNISLYEVRADYSLLRLDKAERLHRVASTSCRTNRTALASAWWKNASPGYRRVSPATTATRPSSLLRNYDPETTVVPLTVCAR